ncbi:MAG: GNAT family N-acetyltransferase [Caulobacter sp.]|nr:GNAT family N-acetyltransferase [Caulobacter sp.]
MKPALVTVRLRLRPVTPADVDDLHGLELDSRVMRYLNGGQPTPREVPPGNATLYRMPRGLEDDVWSALRLDDGQFMGWFALDVSAGGVGHLGYRLKHEAWGQGYGFEGAAALVEHGFRGLDLSAIHADTMAVNHGSRRIMEKLGMTLLRRYREACNDPIPGSEEGEVEYRITRQAWLARAG